MTTDPIVPVYLPADLVRRLAHQNTTGYIRHADGILIRAACILAHAHQTRPQTP